MAETKDLAEDEVRVLRDELSHIADALGVASYGGCYEQAEVLERAKALAKRVEELQAEVERGKALIVRDRTGMASALNGIREIARGYRWIPEGELGSYTHAGCGEGVELTETILREEIGRCLDEIRAVATGALAASGDCVNEMFATRRAGRTS